jgi:hypothetical protein
MDPKDEDKEESSSSSMAKICAQKETIGSKEGESSFYDEDVEEEEQENGQDDPQSKEKLHHGPHHHQTDGLKLLSKIEESEETAAEDFDFIETSLKQETKRSACTQTTLSELIGMEFKSLSKKSRDSFNQLQYVSPHVFHSILNIPLIN